jgi:coenzyme F420-reducing hydrogenase alpha subunit
VELGLTAAGTEKVDVQKQDRSVAVKTDPKPAGNSTPVIPATKGESDMSKDLFATKEEMATFITDAVVKATGPAVKTELGAILGGSAEKSEKTDMEKLTDTVTTLASTVEKMGEKLTGVAEKSEQLGTVPAGTEGVTDDIPPAKVNVAEKGERGSVFSGMFNGAEGFDNSMGGAG